MFKKVKEFLFGKAPAETGYKVVPENYSPVKATEPAVIAAFAPEVPAAWPFPIDKPPEVAPEVTSTTTKKVVKPRKPRTPKPKA